MQFQCECGQELSADDSLMGTEVVCPKCQVQLEVPLSDAAIRNEHLTHEAWLLAIGKFCLFAYLALAVLTPLCFAFLVFMINRQFLSYFPVVLVSIAVDLVIAKIGHGLWNLNDESRKLAAIAAAFGAVVSLPVGTIPALYVLKILVAPHSAYVCTRRYKKAMNNTPEIRPRTPPMFWALLAAPLIAAIIGIVLIMIAVNTAV